MGDQPRLPKYYAAGFRESQCRWAAQHLASGFVTCFSFDVATVIESSGLYCDHRTHRAETAHDHAVAHRTSRCSFQHRSPAFPLLPGHGHVGGDIHRLLRTGRHLSCESGCDGVRLAIWNNLVVRQRKLAL
jgi:hypothetical protein